MQGNKIITACLVIVVIFIGGVVLQQARPVLFPFFLALFLSFILYPVQDFFTRIKIPKFLSIIFILLVTFTIIYLLGALFYSAGKTFATEFPKYGQKISTILISIQEKLNLSPLNLETVDWPKQLELNKIGGLIVSSLGPFFSFISTLFLIFIFLIFILAGRGKTKEKLKKSLDKKNARKIIEVVEKIDGQIQKYLAIKTIVSLFTGILVTVVLLIFGVDFAIVFGFLTFLMNYIPNIGSFIATAFPIIIAFFQFETIWPAFWIMVLLMSIQMIMGNLVEPRLMGRGLGLSPLVVLFFLFFWGWLWGIPGMILSVPIAAIVKIICSNIDELNFIAALMSKD
jgi:predicted PurR-regulated permease PerM